MEGGVRVQGVGTEEAIGLAGRQAAKVSHRHGHLGAGDVVRVTLEVHPQAAHRDLAHEGLRDSQAHFQPLGWSLRLLAAQGHGVELRVVKPRLKQVKAVALPVAGQGEQLLRRHGHGRHWAAGQAAQRRKAFIQAAHSPGGRCAAGQSWKERKGRVNRREDAKERTPGRAEHPGPYPSGRLR